MRQQRYLSPFIIMILVISPLLSEISCIRLDVGSRDIL